MNEVKSGLGAIIPPGTYNVELSLYKALKEVPSELELSQKFGDTGDVIKSRRRQLIAAALDAIFYSHIYSSDEYDPAQPDHPFSLLLSELGHARRDFIHDCERLDNAISAELILAPTSKESTIKQDVIKADRKILIEALVAIELGKNHPNQQMRNESHRIRIVAEKITYTTKSLAHYKKQMKQSIDQMGVENPKSKTEFSEAECKFFIELLGKVSKFSNGPDHPMLMLMAGVTGHTKDRIPKPQSAARIKKDKKAKIGNV